MNQKLIFFDIDGTLVNFKGEMRYSTKKALRELKKAGHKVFICSGRTQHGVYPWLWEYGFDGFVCASGAHVSYEGQDLAKYAITHENLKELLYVMEESECIYDLMTEHYSAMLPEQKGRMKDFFVERMEVKKERVDAIISSMVFRTELEELQDVQKLVYYESKNDLNEIKERLKEHFDVTASSFGDLDPYSGEITIKGVHKAHGIQIVLDHLGMTREDVIAFGDGPNDWEMMEYAGVGIAMGNASQELKDKADYVTTYIDEDGIWNAVRELHLI